MCRRADKLSCEGVLLEYLVWPVPQFVCRLVERRHPERREELRGVREECPTHWIIVASDLPHRGVQFLEENHGGVDARPSPVAVS